MEKGLYPEIHPANSFVGNVLRTEMLSQWGLTQQLLDESVAYYLYMAQRTGTLWENITPEASCNHGFASHVVHLLYRDVLGLNEIDPRGKSVSVRFSDLDLSWCEGRVPLASGTVSLRWRKDSGKMVYRLELPYGFRASIKNFSGLELVPE
jgi:alpha-L-rhamnosidase